MDGHIASVRRQLLWPEGTCAVDLLHVPVRKRHYISHEQNLSSHVSIGADHERLNTDQLMRPPVYVADRTGGGLSRLGGVRAG